MTYNPEFKLNDNINGDDGGCWQAMVNLMEQQFDQSYPGWRQEWKEEWGKKFDRQEISSGSYADNVLMLTVTIRNLHLWCGPTDRLDLLHRNLCLLCPRRQNGWFQFLHLCVLSALWASWRASAHAVTLKWQLCTNNPVNTNSSLEVLTQYMNCWKSPSCIFWSTL